MSRARVVVSGFVSVASALISAPVAFSAAPAQPSSQQYILAAYPILTGEARALDGDTLDLVTATGTVRIRLEGIDAAEGGQRCKLRLIGTWDCGRAAKIALEQLVHGAIVTCDNRGPDKYERTLGVCRAHGRVVNAELVRAGLAWAFTRYSDLYVAEEAEARKARVGIWQAAWTMPPWEWRAQQRLQHAAKTQPSADVVTAAPTLQAPQRAAAGVPVAPPTGCDIKGNETRTGRIYHTTASPWYERLRMDLGGSRRWFCSEQEAQEAGYRAAGGAKAQ